MKDMNYDESMLDVFIYENQQLLEELENLLLNGEKRNILSSEQINEVFRIMHTVKGSSAMMSFDNLAKLFHALEDMFSMIRDSSSNISEWAAVFDISFKATSFLSGELGKLLAKSEPDGDPATLILKIHKIAETLNNPVASVSQTDAAAPSIAVSAVGSNSNPCYKIKLSFEANCRMENIRALGVVTSMQNHCTQVAYSPSDLSSSESGDEIAKNGFVIYVRSNENPDSLKRLIEQTLFMQTFSVIPVEDGNEEIPLVMRGQSPEGTAEVVAATDAISKQNFISVNVNKLDTLLNVVGEIVTAQSMVVSNQDLKGLQLENFNSAASQLKSLISELQDVVMSIRMLPISTVFSKMKRIVRDMSKKCDKDVELVLVGEETEVDKNVIDSLSDPLMHIIRNSVDHGIESKEERKKSGKFATGKVTLAAATTGSDVVVTISDDGKGLDRDAIIRKAIEKGLIDKSEKDISDKEAFSYIFLPGFSTKDAVSEFSGRGVGMDVVRRNISEVGGTISVESKQGEGTTQTIRIPLTLTIVDGMRFLIGKQSFIIPTLSVCEAFKPNIKDILTDPQGNEMVMIRNNCYPILRLYERFGIQNACTDLCEGMLILVESDGNSVCILIDSLEGENQVVIKSLPMYLQKCTTSLDGVSGCAILGDGSICLIIDVNGLISY